MMKKALCMGLFFYVGVMLASHAWAMEVACPEIENNIKSIEPRFFSFENLKSKLKSDFLEQKDCIIPPEERFEYVPEESNTDLALIEYTVTLRNDDKIKVFRSGKENYGAFFEGKESTKGVPLRLEGISETELCKQKKNLYRIISKRAVFPWDLLPEEVRHKIIELSMSDGLREKIDAIAEEEKRWKEKGSVFVGQQFQKALTEFHEYIGAKSLMNLNRLSFLNELGTACKHRERFLKRSSSVFLDLESITVMMLPECPIEGPVCMRFGRDEEFYPHVQPQDKPKLRSYIKMPLMWKLITYQCLVFKKEPGLSDLAQECTII